MWSRPLPPLVAFDLKNLELFRRRQAIAKDVLKMRDRFPVVIMKGDVEPQHIATPEKLSEMAGVICHSDHDVIELLCHGRKLFFKERELEHVHILINMKEPKMDENLWDLYQRYHEHDLILYVSIIEDPVPSGYCMQSVPVVNHMSSLLRHLKLHMVIHHGMFKEMNMPKRKLHSVMLLRQEDID